MKGKKKEKKENVSVEQDNINEDNKMNETVANNRKSFLVVSIISLFVIFICVFLILFLRGSVDREKLEKNFTITSVEPKSKGNYVSNNETFIVKTSSADEEIVRSHLYVEPAVNYEIKRINSKEYEVSLRDVPSDTIVNLSLVKDEVKSYSWAFQTTKDLRVISVYPANGASTVDTSSGISVTLSYPNVENFEEHFEISPKVEGTLSQNGRTWRFIPSQKLKNETTYTITITSGLKAGDYTLEETYVSSFYTNNRPANSSTIDDLDGKKSYHSSITVDRINTFTPSEKITFKMYYVPNTITKIKLYKFNSYNDFMSFLNNEKTYKAKDLGEQKFTYKSDNFTYVLEKSFDEGYYVEEVYLSTGELYATVPVQINKLSAFLVASNFDILTWVGSANELLKNINVSYDGKKVKTDDSGLALIRNYNNENSTGIKYVTVGDNNPLVIGVNDNNYINYPSGYIYTDRPLYKNNDTINIWGYIPIKFYKEMNIDFDKKNVLLTINDQKIPIEISDNGTFITKYTVDNLMDCYLSIDLKYKNSYIASRGVEVKNYTKQNYQYTVIYDKNYVRPGDTFKFTIHVDHVTGISVQNKTVVASYKGKTYSKVTDSAGNASFSIPVDKYSYDETLKAYRSTGNIEYNYVEIKTGDSDYNENDFSFPFYNVLYLLNEENYNYDYKNKTASFDIYNLSLNSNEKADWYNIYDVLKSGKYYGDVEVHLFEIKENRVFSYTYYNEYTQKNEDIYTYVQEYEKEVESDKISATDGKVSYKIKYNLKNDEKDTSYYYSLVFVLKDKEGKKYFFNGYLYNYSQMEEMYSKYGYSSSYYSGLYSDDYEYYRYYFNENKNYKYSVDDQIKLLLKAFDNSEITSGKILRISLKDSIIENKIFDIKDNLDTKFKEGDIPGVTYTGALFKDGKFYRIPAVYYDYNEEDSRTTIDIKVDKDSYKPGEEVVVKIKTTDKNGNPVKSNVNLSVVDKAIFNVVPDSTDILGSIYSNRLLKAYLYSSYRDYSLGTNGGGMGDSGGDARSNFGDTVFFNEVETDNNGEAEVKFKLNDSVTTFVLTAHSANGDVLVGDSKKEIVSTIPLAISVIEPNGLKTSDDVVISANSVGSVKEDVKYVFTLKELDKKVEKTGLVGSTVYANFGKLPEGTYTVNISASSGDKKDSIEFPFVVKTTQQEIVVKETSKVNKISKIKPLKNPIILEFYKDGFSTYMKYLDIMIDTNQDRLDTRVAYYKALELENKYYGNDYPIHVNDMSKFNNNGILRYLQNDENSELVTALVNYYYPNIYELEASKYYELLDNTEFASVAIDELLVLASMKEPVLDQLNYFNGVKDADNESIAKLSLAYAFIGDYDKAKELYQKVKDDPEVEGLAAIISTFVDKTDAEKRIDTLYNKDVASRYVYFAMMSYFTNNEVDLSKESTIKVSYSGKTEVIKLKGLIMKKLIVNSKDLETLTISSDDNRDMVNYYYQGGISEVPESNIKRNIKISLDKTNAKIGDTVNLKIDISSLSGVYGNLKIYLPNSMRFSGSIKGKGAYISSNQGEYLVVYISEMHDNIITIPLYISYPGSYKVEEAILKDKNNYYVSNSLDVNIK